jgi:hypothetical protein
VPAFAVARDSNYDFALMRDGVVDGYRRSATANTAAWHAASADTTMAWSCALATQGWLFTAGARPAADDSAIGALVVRQTSDGKLAARLDVIGTGTVEVSAMAAAPGTTGDAIIVGWFTESVRLGDFMLSSAGSRDGFYARITPQGRVLWAYRVGGNDDDQLTAVATDAQRNDFALAGSFVERADWRGQTLTARHPNSGSANTVVARIASDGSLSWHAEFGGRRQLVTAGVALLSNGRIAVAATGRDEVEWPGKTIYISGPSDGVVAWYEANGDFLGADALGGLDYDGITGIAASADDHVVVAGWCSGTCSLGTTTVKGDDGDAAYLATVGVNQPAQFATVFASASHEWVGSFAVDPTTHQWTALARSLAPLAVDQRQTEHTTLLIHSALP